MIHNNRLFVRVLLAMIVFGFLFAGAAQTQHFISVASTGDPRPVVVENATIDGVPIVAGDEIGVFDNTLCVGSIVFSGTFNATITIWMEVALPGGGVLPGAMTGNPMTFKVWRQSSNTELPATPAYSVGTGTFGEALTVVSLTSVTGLPPFVFRVERATGDVFAMGSFMGGGADLAERINVSEPVEPGDVVELDPRRPTYYRKARGTSDLIAGVITTSPGFTLGNNPEEMEQTGEQASGRPMLALMGRVPVKVTTENGPIHPGDLLTVASKPGYAMHCSAIKNCAGAVIGKALETLEKGEGKILVLVMAK